MSSSRAESQHASTRRRSNTAQSVYRPMMAQPIINIPLKVGDTRVLNAWVHENKESPDVIFNRMHWPGDCQGSLVRVTAVGGLESAGFLFVVPLDAPVVKDKLQASDRNPNFWLSCTTLTPDPSSDLHPETYCRRI